MTSKYVLSKRAALRVATVVGSLHPRYIREQCGRRAHTPLCGARCRPRPQRPGHLLARVGPGRLVGTQFRLSAQHGAIKWPAECAPSLRPRGARRGVLRASPRQSRAHGDGQQQIVVDSHQMCATCARRKRQRSGHHSPERRRHRGGRATAGRFCGPGSACRTRHTVASLRRESTCGTLSLRFDENLPVATVIVFELNSKVAPNL